MSRISTPALLATIGALAIALTGCSAASPTPDASSSSGSGSVAGGPDGKTAFAVTADPDLASEAAKLITSGTLKLATSAATPPYEYYEDGTQTLRGADIDLGYAIAAKLGLKAEFTSLDFSGIIPAIDAGRFDFSLAGMGDTPTREETVDFVDYSTDSNSVVTVKGNPKNISGIESLCGLKVSSVEGSVLLGLLDEQNAKCTEKMEITNFKDNATALLQVQSGRADATMYQTGVAGYLIKTDSNSANLEVVSNTEYGKGYNAIAFNKDDSALRDLVQKALTQLGDDGIYAQIYDTWGLTDNVVDEFTVNDGLKYNQPS